MRYQEHSTNSLEHSNDFLTHLAVKEKVSVSTQNQALLALLFFYRNVIGREVGEVILMSCCLDRMVDIQQSHTDGQPIRGRRRC